MSDDGYCVRCDKAPAVKDGLCSHCTWAVQAEINEGLRQLSDYLGKWAAFTEYLYERDPAKRARKVERRRRWFGHGVPA